MVRDKHFDILLIRWHDFPGNQSGNQFSHSVMSDSLWPRGLQHARLPCQSPTPRTCLNSCLSSRWCHPISSWSIVPFSSCLQAFLVSFPMSQFFTSGGQSIGVSAFQRILEIGILENWKLEYSVFPMNSQDWFPLGLTGLSPCCPRDSQESSLIPQFKSINQCSAFFTV